MHTYIHTTYLDLVHELLRLLHVALLPRRLGLLLRLLDLRLQLQDLPQTQKRSVHMPRPDTHASFIVLF
jgi:hypothetical protein